MDRIFARAIIVDGRITLSLLFRLNDAGLITSVRTESRCTSMGKDRVMGMLP